MQHQNYLPDSDSGKVLWFQNFRIALAANATTLGITTAQVDSVNADFLFFAYLVAQIVTVKEYVKTFASYKDAIRDGSTAPGGDIPAPPNFTGAPTPVEPGVFGRVAVLVKSIKNNANYNETIGNALGIIGTAINTDTATIKPVLKATIKNSHAYISWTHQHTKAAELKVDLGDSAGYVLVGRINTVHYLDPHLPPMGQSKVYKYILQYVVDEQLVGFPSDPISITVTGV